MSIEEIDAKAAHERLKTEDKSIYLDVRSVQEYDQGHPEAAWNIPIMLATAGGMTPNPDFERVVQAVLPKDSLLAVGCRSGQRSMMACQLLSGLGYDRAFNVGGGFVGAVNPMTGEVSQPGWESCGLPTSSTATPEKSWQELQAAAEAGNGATT
jgi:rhodanese-related sulfurtransferase